MKKGLIIFTAVCAIITVITLTSCSNMLEDLRRTKNKTEEAKETEGLLKIIPDSKKKTNRVKIVVESGDEEIEKTGYVFSEPETEKNWKNAEEVLKNVSLKEITEDSNGKYIIYATDNGDYTVAVKDKNGKTKYKKVKIRNIIPVQMKIPEVSIKKAGESFDVTITGLNIAEDDFDPASFTLVCTDSSGNEVKQITQGAAFTRNTDGSVKVNLIVPENKGKYEITIECNTKEYGDLYLNGTLSAEIFYYTVTFNTNGGSTVESIKVEEGTKAQKPAADPTKEGEGSIYEFQGWLDASGTAYNFSAAVNADITLNAKWKETLDFSFYEELKKIDDTHVQFGAWPQKIKESNVEIDTKISCEQGMFTYYKGNYKNGKSAGWYVKCQESNSSDLTYSDGSAVGNDEKYFKLEPVKWRVLTENYNNTGRELLLAEDILYAIAYYDGGNEPRSVSDNNYENSRIRAFLNGLNYNLNNDDNDEWKDKGFLQTAFTQANAQKIKVTDVINNARSTNSANDSTYFNNGENIYASDSVTKDKIFLLSVQEVTNKGYGFSEDYNTNAQDWNRVRKVTDFAVANTAWAKADTVYKSNGYWWLRSPNFDAFKVNVINFDGSSYVMTASSSSYGVVPAMTANLETNISHSPNFYDKPEILEGADKDGTAGTEGDYVLFGVWPQTIKAAGVTVDETTTIKQGMFTYCLGSDDEWYVEQAEMACDSNYKYSDGSNVGKGGKSKKWFKVEPIKWRVLTKEFDHDNDESTDKQWLLLAENILTSRVPYHLNEINRTIGNDTVYPNNYKYSAIRAWLNGKYEDDDTQEKTYAKKGFLQSAFTSAVQNALQATKVDNSAESTTDASGNGPQATDYKCDDTSDIIFLLSEKEVTTSDYGFGDFSSNGKGTKRIRMTTDYARATGAYQSSTSGYGGWWWLRSPDFNISFIARYVDYGGYTGLSNYVISTCVGIVPALSISAQ